jgi:TRAP-type mannitol/chloroaromatic compound transport system permease large subunit
MTAVLGIAFVVGLAIGLPIAFVMGIGGFLALVYEGKLSLLSVPQRLFDGINSFPLMAVPFFILAADLMTASGITTALLRFSNTLVGHKREVEDHGASKVVAARARRAPGLAGGSVAELAGGVRRLVAE